jgi:acyl dehydratase
MKVFTGIDELEKAVGTHLGYSDWLTITQDRVDAIAEATGDHQWIHTDPERAAAGPFGATIAHGYLTLSLVTMLVQQIYRVEGMRMGINYVSNKVRFPAPVKVGSRLRAEAELVDVQRTSIGAQATVRVTIACEGAAKPACVAEILSVMVE